MLLVGLVACGGGEAPSGPSSVPEGSATAPEPSAAATSNATVDRFTVAELSPEQGTLATLLAEHAELAAEADRRIFVQVYAEWCGPCVRLRDAMPDERMQQAFEGTYIVQLNADLWKTALADSAFANPSIPRFHELGPTGGPTGRFVTGAAWDADVPENMAPILHRFFRDLRRY